MSYVSLLKNIPEVLSQPAGIAAIASVGIHGAIALIVPLIPVNSQPPQDSSSQKTVGVLELSQADQSRLPQTPDNKSIALQPQTPLLQNQFPQQPQQINPSNFDNPTTVLPPLPPPLTTPSSLPPINTIPSNYPIAGLPQNQTLPTPPRRNFRFNDSGLNFANKRFTPVTPGNFDPKEVVPNAGRPLPVDNLPELNAAKLPSDLPATPPVTTETNDNNQANTQPVDETTKVAPIAKTPTVGDDLVLGTQSIPKWQRGSTPNLPDLTTKQAEQGQIALVNSYESLRKALQQKYPNSQEKAVIRQTVSTDKPGMEGTVLGVLVVDTDGKLVDMHVQDRSIAPQLQLKARDYFKKNTPKGDKQISLYPFSLRFQNTTSNTSESNQITNPAVVIPNSGSNSSVNNSQPTTKPATVSPTSSQREVDKNQPVPQVTITPVNPGNQPQPEVTITPTSEQSIQKEELSSSLKSSRELIQQLQNLRETRQQEQKVNSSKN